MGYSLRRLVRARTGLLVAPLAVAALLVGVPAAGASPAKPASGAAAGAAQQGSLRLARRAAAPPPGRPAA